MRLLEEMEDSGVLEFKLKQMKKIVVLIILFTIYKGYSQDNQEDIVKTISVYACDCISKINTENNSKNSAIKNCIAASVVKNLKTEVAVGENDVSEIQLEASAYKKIEVYLVENCTALKQLSFTESEEF